MANAVMIMIHEIKVKKQLIATTNTPYSVGRQVLPLSSDIFFLVQVNG